ncbi:hypothetical protein EJ05DRAFT_181926 [Pseudovirgaria hyperparasitica]|uniref:Pre-mRNA splicing factor CLF1 n=1 Tax=Pseudovirgaria hyperparasitica TaxID=470096 RepID=A0A6A6WHV9_9PEZI|nr:uncharacterized protein EJ05DRAFT_181926 [Pseudovirgaria hyperparasitica]KAF2761685.1 hypothetical protein EJ05DRAFT_181926 [Pseudovirgaria hyperparasitica]
MSLPKPQTELKGQCSVVYQNTLFVYSPDAFQSIELSEGAAWASLDKGTSIAGAQCVNVVSADNPDADALFIVGGRPIAEDIITAYPGLQRYSYKDKKWDWIRPGDWVTQNRQNHGAAYLNSTKQLLVYAGSQSGDTGPSSATFLISTEPPYAVSATSSSAPPSVNPILLPWNDTTTIVLGGSEQNKNVYTFSSPGGWQELGVDLEQGIHQATMQTTVIAGDDGSKVLEVFDMGSTPNVVKRVVLLGKDGQVAPFGQTVGPPPTSRTKRLDVNNWPEYNATYAPSTSRTGFSVASAPNGYAVISGGNVDDPLCIFDQRQNSWVNATALFAGSQVIVTGEPDPSTTPTPSAIATPTSSATPSTTPVVASDGKDRMLTVLGATLGTIFGIAAILLVILLLLRWKRLKRERAQGDDYIEKEGRLSFADRGADFMKEAGISNRDSPSGRKPWQTSMNGSHSSLAIITGRAGQGHKRAQGSDASTAGLTLHKGPLGYNDAVEMTRIKEHPSDDALRKEIGGGMLTPAAAKSAPKQGQRSSGWSRYFSGNEATNLANMRTDRSTYASDRTSGNSESNYTSSRIGSQPLQQIAPLDVKFENQRISRVATGSPTLGHSHEDLHGQQAQLARANSLNGSVSSLGADDDHHAEATQGWSPVPPSNWLDRPTSSTYTDSNRGSGFPIQDGASSFYNSDYSSSRNVDRDTISDLYARPAIPVGRESTVTVFPRGTPATQQSRGPNGKTQGDMSWLNLGVGNH